MAGKLLDKSRTQEWSTLNSHTGIKCAIDEGEEDGMLIGETTIGETAISETTISEAMICTSFVEAEPRGGHETILLARNGTEAVAAFHQLSEPIDLLLADVVMPGMDGRDLAAKFETLCPHARVLLMSGYAGQLAWCHMSPHGRTCLAKPFSARTLLKKVREVLDTNPFEAGAQA
jgi:CheY-like chemotaxis protein